MRNQTIRYLIVPGWQGSADEHWQSHWQRSLPNSARVEQADWLNPKREDWVAELQRSIASDPRPTILIAHSLGCITVAHWAAQAPVESLRRVRAALLVAPADVERANCPPALQNFAPIPQHLLPFPSQLVGSAPEAALRLGSAGFHEISATSSRAASRAWSTPRKFTVMGAPHSRRARYAPVAHTEPASMGTAKLPQSNDHTPACKMLSLEDEPSQAAI